MTCKNSFSYEVMREIVAGKVTMIRWSTQSNVVDSFSSEQQRISNALKRGRALLALVSWCPITSLAYRRYGGKSYWDRSLKSTKLHGAQALERPLRLPEKKKRRGRKSCS